ncbi:hypothetical protein RCS94_05845 [Orbaceae bacterium ac157xtp]
MPICAFSLLISTSSYGALSATSANTIKGNAPWFTGQSGAKKLGFVVDGISYSEANDAYDAVRNPNKDKIISGIPKNFNSSLKLRDFTVTGLTANDFSPTADYYDADGDTGYTLATDAFSMGSVTYDWYQGNTKLDKSNSTVMNQTLGCGSGLSLPLTLKITLPSVKVKSRYGNPKESGETDLVQEYKIGSESGICFAKPGSLHWDGSVTPNATSGGGYTSDFDPANGFKASASPKFPTTGFPGAYFYLVMTSNATDYTFTHNGGTAITVGTNGKVTLNSKPTGPVRIWATYNSNPPEVHTYTFDPTTIWVVPKKNLATASAPIRYSYSYAEAKTECGDEPKIANRAQLSNSPKNILPSSGGIPGNYATRAIGGGIFGEWGHTSTYSNSEWISSWYWTGDSVSSTYRFIVNSNGGIVNYNSMNSGKDYVACLE